MTAFAGIGVIESEGKVPPHRVNGRGLTPEVSPMHSESTTPRHPRFVRVDLMHAHGTRSRYRKGCHCSLCRAANAEVVRLRRAADPEKAEEYQRCYLAAHPGMAAEYHRNWDQATREKWMKYNRSYRQEHPEAVKEWDHRKRAKRLKAPGSHTAADIAAQRTRQKGRCYWCKQKVGKAYHTDHVIPLVKKGSNGPDNLVIACPLCNLSKGAKHPMDFAGVMF